MAIEELELCLELKSLKAEASTKASFCEVWLILGHAGLTYLGLFEIIYCILF